jgi:sulfide dehydrogenase cytochrome subunit
MRNVSSFPRDTESGFDGDFNFNKLQKILNINQNRDNNIMTKKYIEYTLLLCAGLFSFSLMSSARAIDVDKVTETCANCHGKNGASTETDIPIIAGYSADTTIGNLNAYKNKDRDCPKTKYRAGSKKGKKTDMCEMVKDLNDSDIKQIAQFFAKQKFVRAKQKSDPALAKNGKDVHDMYCEECHSGGGSVASDDAGILAGQWIPYLKQSFADYSSAKRPIPKKMKVKMDELKKTDIDALINYYGSFQ